MPAKPETDVPLQSFAGMASNLDPRELRPGVAQVQINVAVLRPGELVLRRGLRDLEFDADNT